MKLLAYDTSSDVLSLAVFDGQRRLAEFDSPSFARHSGVLAPAIRNTLKKAGLKMDDIDCLAVGLGPGSFTGLRVGITTAKVLAWALRKKIVGVCSLEAMADPFRRQSRWVAVLVDAKKHSVYAAVYKPENGRLKTVVKPSLLPLESLLRKIRRPAFFVGSGAVMYEDLIRRSGASGGPEATVEIRPSHPEAGHIASVAVDRIRRKKFVDPFQLNPLYLHPRDCNVTRK